MLFTFPSRYWFAIGLLVVFSLTGWYRLIQTGFLQSRPTQDTATNYIITCTGLSPFIADFPKSFHFLYLFVIAVLQPRLCRNNAGLGFFPFARHYLGNHYYFLFLRLIRCFSSPGLLPVKQGILHSCKMGCPIRKSTDQRLFAPTRCLSQLITSFFASESQGIPCTLLVTYSFVSIKNYELRIKKYNS